MKKLIYISVLFALCTLGLYFGILFIINSINYKSKPAVYITNDYYIWKGGDTYEKFKSADSLQNLDVIIAGSSRAYRHYNPLYFRSRGISAWNLGSSAQTIENTYSVVKNVVIPSSPRVLLLDVASLGFESKSIESSVDLITNTDYPKVKYDLLIQNKDIRLFNTAVVSFYNRTRDTMFSEPDYVAAGFSARSDSLSSEWLLKLESLSKQSKKEPKEINLQPLVDIVLICKRQKQKLILIHSPISDFYDVEEQNRFISKVEEIAQVNGVPFYNFQTIEGINTKHHFFDNSHMNKAGVEIFNQSVLDSITFH